MSSNQLKALVMPLDGENTKLLLGVKRDKDTGENEPFILIQPADIPPEHLDEQGVCKSGEYPVVVLPFPSPNAMLGFGRWFNEAAEQLVQQMQPAPQQAMRDLLKVIQGGKGTAELVTDDSDQAVIEAMKQKGDHTQH